MLSGLKINLEVDPQKGRVLAERLGDERFEDSLAHCREYHENECEARIER